MAQARDQPVAVEQVLFEPDEVTLADDRLTVSGRWFGVRGRRFVRPTLTLIGETERVRLLAELEHKPWSAFDGEPWMAAFACEPDGAAVNELELAVAPDIAVLLQAPDALRTRQPSPGRSARASGPRAAVAAEREPGRAPRSEPSPDALALRGENAALRAAADQHQAELARLQELLTRNELARAEWSAAISRRDAAVAKLEAVLAEREETLRQRDAAVQERDAAVRERDAAGRERDAAVRERDAALGERDAAVRERDAAARRAAQTGRREEGVARLAAEAAGDRDRLTRAHDRLLHEYEQVRAQLADALAARDAAVASLQAARAQAAADPRPDRSPPPASQGHTPPLRRAPRVRTLAQHAPQGVWLTRAFALAVLLAVVVALLLVLQSA